MVKKPRPPIDEIRQELLKVVLAADEPLTVASISKLLSPTHKTSAKDLALLIEECAATGTLHRIPATTAKGKLRYWAHDAVEFGRRAVLRLLDAKGPQTAAKLKTAAKGLSPAQFESILQALIAGRAVYLHPPVGKTKKELFGSKPPSPDKYLQDVGAELSKVVARLTAANVPREELRRALVQLIEAAGVPFAANSSARDTTPNGRDTATVDLIALMRRIEPRADRGALIGSRDLRHAAHLEKTTFDRAVLELARQGHVSLHRHDFAGSLSPAERDELVADRAGNHYVGVALRQSEDVRAPVIVSEGAEK